MGCSQKHESALKRVPAAALPLQLQKCQAYHFAKQYYTLWNMLAFDVNQKASFAFKRAAFLEDLHVVLHYATPCVLHRMRYPTIHRLKLVGLKVHCTFSHSNNYFASLGMLSPLPDKTYFTSLGMLSPLPDKTYFHACCLPQQKE